MSTKINTIEDAKNLVLNSGVIDWEFGENASLDGFADFIYNKTRMINSRNFNNVLRVYLKSVGENIADYNL